jgi:hypothetical protein
MDQYVIKIFQLQTFLNILNSAALRKSFVDGCFVDCETVWTCRWVPPFGGVFCFHPQRWRLFHHRHNLKSYITSLSFLVIYVNTKINIVHVYEYPILGHPFANILSKFYFVIRNISYEEWFWICRHATMKPRQSGLMYTKCECYLCIVLRPNEKVSIHGDVVSRGTLFSAVTFHVPHVNIGTFPLCRTLFCNDG